MQEILLQLALSIAVPIVVFALIGWDPRKAHENHLHAPLGLLAFFGFCGTGGVILCSYSLMNSSQEYLEEQAIWIWLLLLVFIFTLITCVELSRRFAFWDGNGITISRFLRPDVRYSWAELVGLERVDIAQAWRLRFDNGMGFGFNDFMQGTEDLAAEARSILLNGR